jgi:hypothetical protein
MHNSLSRNPIKASPKIMKKNKTVPPKNKRKQNETN